MGTWKRDFASGLIVLAPILATLFFLFLFYDFLVNLTPGILITPELLELVLPGVGDSAREHIAQFLQVILILLLMALLTISIGYLMRTTAGVLVEGVVDNAANRVPGVRVVYNASKTAAETALGEEKSLKTPVKLETWNGLRMTAFKTGQTTEDGRITVFLPTSPNITTGFILEVEPERITELDESVEEALTRVVSAGFGDANRNTNDLGAGVPIDVIDQRVINMVTDERTKETDEESSRQADRP